MPSAPINHELNLLSQDIMSYASYALTVVLIGWAIRMGRKERTPFYVLAILASMVAAFAEPLYDEAFSLYFYTNGGIQGFYTAFDVPQPIWSHSGYALLYALPTIFICQKIWQGRLTAKNLYFWAGVELVESCAFEMTGININTYTYWGPHVFRVFQYPLVIGMLEMAQVMCFAIAAAQLRAHARSNWSLLGLFVIFPVTFFGANFGAGAAVIIAIHAEGTNTTIITLCTLVSMASAVALVRLAAAMIPAPPTEPVEESILPRQSLTTVSS
jgi:hypothetical protein